MIKREERIDNMISSNTTINNVATEVVLVLKNSSQDILNKIPQTLINKLEMISNKEYTIQLDTNKSLLEQELIPETFSILAGIYLKYCATDEVKKSFYSKAKPNVIEVTQNKSIDKVEEIVNVEHIDIQEDLKENISHNNQALQEVKKISWFKKLIINIKSIFIR